MCSKVLNAYNTAHKLEMQIKVAITQEKVKNFLNFTCPICIEPMMVYFNAPCKHYVCKDCYLKSLDSVNGNKCCICRKILHIKQ